MPSLIKSPLRELNVFRMTTKLKIGTIRGGGWGEGEWAHNCHNLWYNIQSEGEMTNDLDCNKGFTFPLTTQTTKLSGMALCSYIAQ
jgi:hypothetical protein